MRRKIFICAAEAAGIVCAVLLISSCRGYKQIPEETLADIFKDMYELNAYLDRNPMNLKLDSVDVYGPLLEKYGYTPRDFTNTLTDAAKRKSFRMTDIVEAAIVKMEAEQAAIMEKVRITEKIDSVALAVSRREIFRDSLITIRSMDDSSKMRLKVPLEDAAGKIEITYYYTLDSLDRNKDLSNRHVILDSKGVSRTSSAQKLLSRKRTRYNTSLTVMEDEAQLEISFGNYPAEPKRMHLTIDSLVVVHQPTLKRAYEILSHEYSYRLLIDEKEYYEYYPPKENSSSLYLLSPLIDSERDSILVE